MPFEFMCGDKWYKYEDGWIQHRNLSDYYTPLCPVRQELIDKLDAFDTEQLHLIMSALVHSYGYGKVRGKQEKIQEFKRVFQLD